MKQVKIVIVTLLVCSGLLLVGCGLDPNDLEGKYVRDVKGTVYRVKAVVGHTYFLSKVDLGNLQETVSRIQEMADMQSYSKPDCKEVRP